MNEKNMHTAMVLFTIFLRVDSVLVAHSEPSFSKAAYISSNVGLLNMLSICVLWSAKANGLSVAHYNRCTNNWDNYYKTRQRFSFFCKHDILFHWENSPMNKSSTWTYIVCLKHTCKHYAVKTYHSPKKLPTSLPISILWQDKTAYSSQIT